MTPMRFVSCTDADCPLNESNVCRASFIRIGNSGRCKAKKDHVSQPKSQTDQYVEIQECQCQKCDHWEFDQSTGAGSCALGNDLVFLKTSNSPLCNDYMKQIDSPGFTATNV